MWNNIQTIHTVHHIKIKYHYFEYKTFVQLLYFKNVHFIRIEKFLYTIHVKNNIKCYHVILLITKVIVCFKCVNSKLLIQLIRVQNYKDHSNSFQCKNYKFNTSMLSSGDLYEITIFNKFKALFWRLIWNYHIQKKFNALFWRLIWNYHIQTNSMLNNHLRLIWFKNYKNYGITMFYHSHSKIYQL